MKWDGSGRQAGKPRRRRLMPSLPILRTFHRIDKCKSEKWKSINFVHPRHEQEAHATWGGNLFIREFDVPTQTNVLCVRVFAEVSLSIPNENTNMKKYQNRNREDILYINGVASYHGTNGATMTMWR